MAVLSARPGAEELPDWSYVPDFVAPVAHPEQDASIPVLLVRGSAPPGVTGRITISAAPPGTTWELTAINPLTAPWGVLGVAPADLFGATQGVIQADGTWSTDILIANSHGLCICAQQIIPPAPDPNNPIFTDNFKQIIVSEPPVETNAPNNGGYLVYYSSAVGEAHTPALLTPNAFATRLAADLQDAHGVYTAPAWGFGSGVFALAFHDQRLGATRGKQRVVVMRNDYTERFSQASGVVIPKVLASDMGRRFDSIMYLDCEMAPAPGGNGLNGYPALPDPGRPNAYLDAVAGHELMHMFQFRMRNDAGADWFMEACAEWAYQAAFPNNDWWLQTLTAFGLYFDVMDDPAAHWELALDYADPSTGYGKAVFFKYVSDFLANGPNAIYQMWRRAAPVYIGEVPLGQGLTPTRAIAAELAARGTSLAQVFQNFATTNWLRFGIDPGAYSDDTRQRWAGFGPVTAVQFPPNIMMPILSVPPSASSLGTIVRHLAPSYRLVLPASASATGRLVVTVSGSAAGRGVGAQDQVWRLQATRIPAAGPQEVFGFTYRGFNPTADQYGWQAEVSPFGVSGAAVIVSNVTYTDPPNIAQGPLAYDLWAELI
jgi:hypothetical protein